MKHDIRSAALPSNSSGDILYGLRWIYCQKNPDYHRCCSFCEAPRLFGSVL